MSAQPAPMDPAELGIVLPELPAGAVLPASLDELQGLVREDRARLTGELYEHLRVQIQQRLDAEFERRVAHEVALKVQQIIEQNRLARHRLFGPSSEAAQARLFDEAEALGTGPEEDPEEQAAPARLPGRPRARGHRRALPPELPRVELLIDVPEDKRRDAAGAPMVRIGEEVSEQLDIIPMRIRVIRTIRPRYAPADGGAPPVVAPPAPAVLARSNFSASAIAMVLTAKYADGLPLNRISGVLARHGVAVARQTLARVVIGAARALQPLANLMRDALLAADVICMDETTVQVLREPGRKASSHSYMWVQRGGPPGRTVVLFDYEAGRSGAVPLRLLEGFGGYLMTDDYGGYDAAVARNGMTHLACMAHARRKFVEAARASPRGSSAHTSRALELFGRLYRIEKRVRNAPPELRLRVRDRLSRRALGELHAWLLALHPVVAPRTRLGQAVTYSLNLWPRLMRYIERADLPIDNNACENAIRPFVVGRKAWLFCDTPAGAHASALVYSLVETARANAREPYAWLCHVLERLPLARNADDYEALLPWNVHDSDLAMNLVTAQEWG